MREQFQHSLITSFTLWFDHYLLDKGDAYYNTTGTFHPTTDARIGTGYNIFASAYKQFVNDSSITGATICSGIHTTGGFQNRASGVIIDYDNGRVLSSGIASGAVATGAFSVKDFNIYFVNETEEDLIIENKYKPTSDFPSADAAITPYDMTVPAIFITSETIQNDPFAFGGEDQTRTTIKCVIMSDDIYKLDGVLSVFADSRNEVFKILPMASHPSNEYGDLKNPPYNYTGLAEASGNGLFYVERVFASKLSDKSKKVIPNNLFIGFLDFDVYTHRFPRL
jgi:hypothetical protein